MLDRQMTNHYRIERGREADMSERERWAAADLPSDPRDLLSDEERCALNKDLERMAKMRRRAAANAANMYVG